MEFIVEDEKMIFFLFDELMNSRLAQYLFI